MSAAPTAGADRRQFLQGGVLVAASALTLAMRPRSLPATRGRTLERLIPTRIGAYRHASAEGVVLPPRDELSERIYDDYVARLYVAEAAPPVMLLIAYGRTQDYASQLHRPEICYPASGYAVGERRPVALALGGGRTITATALAAWRPGRREQILYWSRVGDAFPASSWAQRAVLVRDILRGGVPDGVLVRLSTVSADPAAATATLAGFNAALLAATGSAGRAVLLGDAR